MGAERTAGGLPLSPPQLRLWRELKRDPEGHHLLHGFALELTGDLDPAAMAAALGDVVSRHGVLGSRIAGEEAVPVWVTTAESVPFPVDPLGDLGKAEGPLRNPEAEALRRIFGDLRAPLDPAAESPFRPRLLRLGQRRSILSVVVHRLAADPRSLEILGQDFGTAYRARCAGSPPAWPAAPETPAGPLDGDPGACADGPTPEESLEFWRRRLAGVDSETFELPSDHTPPMTPSRETARLPFELEGEVVAALVALDRRGGTDPRAALLALVLGWLSRISGRGDLVVGTPTDSRLPSQGVAVGPFEDWLPLSGDLGDDPTFEQLVARAGTALEEARDHRAVGSGDLAEALNPERVGRRNPFFRVGLDVRSGADPLPDFGDLEVREYDIGPAPSELDLHFILKPRPGGGLLGDVDFALDLFTPATLDAWLDSLVTFAAAAAHGPRRRISELELVPRHQRRHLLEHWRGDDLQLDPEVHLGDLFARRAEAHPEVPAVLCGEGDERRAWTYGELDAASDRLARRLRWLGVGPGVPVALCLDPSFDLALATLATVRAGGCYVPLDPSHPLDHLTYMLEDSAAAVLVSRDGVLERGLGHALRSSAGRSVHLLRLDDESASETGDSPVPDRGEPPTRADEVACIMYTAGIVGRPKGVAVTHRGIARLVLADGVFGLGPGDVVAQVSSPSFDAFNVELWGALVHGGRLVGIGGDARSDPAALRRRLKEDGVTSVLLTTARFNALMHLDPTALRGLRTVMVGGEPADPMVLRQVLEADGAPDRLLNLYGPVETATVATWHPVDRLSASARTVPIGRPIPNTSALVLDRRGRLCPVGVTGELHLGGDGLGRGYVGRPAATAGAFVPDPFRRGGRLFRTGELARWRPDGRLEALGRLDQRVEIRGRHVEIARVEAALGRHPRVRQKVVVVQQDAAGESRLVAFVVPPSPGDPPSASELRDHLELQLPDHMIPSAFLCVGMLPMTPHGKVDRRALPRFDLADGFHDGIFTAPRNELEATLEDIWCDVLDLDRVGVDANFFELGGHSLMASQLLARVRAQLGVGLPARAIHQTPTVASMAERIAAITEEAGADPDPRTEPTAPARPQDIPMSYGQRRVWFFDRLLPGTPLFNLAAAVELLGNLDEDTLRRALAELARRHRVLRCRVVEQNGKVRLRVDEPQGLPLTVDAPTDSGTEHDGTLQRWVDREASRPFDLARGALRARLLRLNPARHVLVLAVHQLAADEHSLELLVRELSSL
ncbi:MAG: amino acid adenylation domain-containing protein, partial [Acidobacteriota bacterium]